MLAFSTPCLCSEGLGTAWHFRRLTHQSFTSLASLFDLPLQPPSRTTSSLCANPSSSSTTSRSGLFASLRPSTWLATANLHQFWGFLTLLSIGQRAGRIIPSRTQSDALAINKAQHPASSISLADSLPLHPLWCYDTFRSSLCFIRRLCCLKRDPWPESGYLPILSAS